MKTIRADCPDHVLDCAIMGEVAHLNMSRVLKVPPYSTSADAVLPLLEKMPGGVTTDFNGHVWQVNLCVHGPSNDWHDGYAPTFPRAACFALLKAKGWTVVESP